MNNILNTGERISEELDFNSYIEQKSTYIFQIQKLLELTKIFKDKNLIDCASGEGYGCDLVKKQLPDLNVTGIDIDVETVNYSLNKYSKINFLSGSILDLGKIIDFKYDFFISNQTFEHLSYFDQKLALEEVYKNLKNSGVLFIAVPNKPVYEIYSPKNPYHLNELDISSFSDLLKTMEWKQIELFGQMSPAYQRDSKIRNFKFISLLLSKIPSYFLKFIKRFLVPTISEKDILIESYNNANLNKYKTLIAICFK